MATGELYYGGVPCNVCGAPSCLSTRKDPFGKSEGWLHYCREHQPQGMFQTLTLSKNTHHAEQAPFQGYWRCAHHLSAIDNFFDRRYSCEWGCHKTTLEWYHCGVHPMPKSWGGDAQ